MFYLTLKTMKNVKYLWLFDSCYTFRSDLLRIKSDLPSIAHVQGVVGWDWNQYSGFEWITAHQKIKRHCDCWHHHISLYSGGLLLINIPLQCRGTLSNLFQIHCFVLCCSLCFFLLFHFTHCIKFSSNFEHTNNYYYVKLSCEFNLNPI